MPATFASLDEVSKALREERIQQRITQALAAKALGVPQTSLCRLEMCQFKKVPLGLIRRYADLLQLEFHSAYSLSPRTKT